MAEFEFELFLGAVGFLEFCLDVSVLVRCGLDQRVTILKLLF